MTAILKVDTIQDTSGNNIINENANTVTIGKSGDTVNVVGTLQNGGTNFLQGITMADSWRITATYTSASGNSTADLTSNWERTDTFGFGQIGTGMTESSGIFSFPSTGIYYIKFNTSAFASGGSRQFIGVQIKTTTDNSNYNLAALSYQHANSTNEYGSPTCDFIFDVTDISTHKVKFAVQDPDPIGYEGDTSIDKTCVKFIRLGDT